jgi:hypothetical protein
MADNSNSVNKRTVVRIESIAGEGPTVLTTTGSSVYPIGTKKLVVFSDGTTQIATFHVDDKAVHPSPELHAAVSNIITSIAKQSGISQTRERSTGDLEMRGEKSSLRRSEDFKTFTVINLSNGEQRTESLSEKEQKAFQIFWEKKSKPIRKEHVVQDTGYDHPGQLFRSVGGKVLAELFLKNDNRGNWWLQVE